MTRNKKPGEQKKKKLEFIVESLSHGWLAEERETAILFDHDSKEVHFETSYPPAARRWLKTLWGDPNVKWDTQADTLKFTVPWDYCRKADLILKAEHR